MLLKKLKINNQIIFLIYLKKINSLDIENNFNKQLIS